MGSDAMREQLASVLREALTYERVAAARAVLAGAILDALQGRPMLADTMPEIAYFCGRLVTLLDIAKVDLPEVCDSLLEELLDAIESMPD